MRTIKIDLSGVLNSEALDDFLKESGINELAEEFLAGFLGEDDQATDSQDTEEKAPEAEDEETTPAGDWVVHVLNDDVNTFADVTDAFYEVLGRTPGEAVNLAFQIHHVGVADVFTGSLEDAGDVVQELHKRGLRTCMEISK